MKSNLEKPQSDLQNEPIAKDDTRGENRKLDPASDYTCMMDFKVKQVVWPRERQQKHLVSFQRVWRRGCGSTREKSCKKTVPVACS